MDNTAIPAVAWQRRLDERLPKPGKPGRPPLPIILRMIPLITRLMRASRRNRERGFDPINLFNNPNPGAVMGVPLGGIGGGCITRGWRGEFRRWTLRPGQPEHAVVPADQFSLYTRRPGEQLQALVLSPVKPADGSLSAWNWALDPACARYHALFPRAWTTYQNPLPGFRLTCRQVSPVIAHNYHESSTPAAVFDWTVENTSSQPLEAALMFSFQFATGAPAYPSSGAGQPFTFAPQADRPPVEGIELQGSMLQARVYAEDEPVPPERETFKDPLSFAIALSPHPGMQVSRCAHFDPAADGAVVWQDFASDGLLSDPPQPFTPGGSTASALAVRFTLKAGEQVSIPFALAWHMPLARFGQGRAYSRRHTLFYGSQPDAAPRIARDALRDYPAWEAAITRWQQPILEDESLPAWYRAALFNELYYIPDGGTIWVRPEGGNEPETDMGHFGYLEGHEYRMINTYDVHFTASFALLTHWPKLELALQRDIANATLQEYPESLTTMFTGQTARRKLAGFVPHDVGWPHEDPWVKVNGYNIHDINRWKDLAPKFVLQVWRDYKATLDLDFLRACWPAVQAALRQAEKADLDGDGLIENSGFPDQTYDTWSVSGASAYTGGLWLACLAAAAGMARALGQRESAERYSIIFKQGQSAYERKLWNGQYYNYDSSSSAQHDSIMADMLAGQWFARASDLPDVVPVRRALSSLNVIYQHNVLGFEGGSMGAVNGCRPHGRVDTSNLQSQEVWVGTSYTLAACLLQHGLDEAAWNTARGVVESTWQRLGYWFQTPEAWTRDGNFRSLAYMRPLAIWAIQWELEQRRSGKKRKIVDNIHSKPNKPIRRKK